MDEVFCPACNGEGAYLGALGRRHYFRCICCGFQFTGDEQ